MQQIQRQKHKCKNKKIQRSRMLIINPAIHYLTKQNCPQVSCNGPLILQNLGRVKKGHQNLKSEGNQDYTVKHFVADIFY